MNIDFANLQLQYQKYKTDIDSNIQAVLNKSNYIMGEEVVELERAVRKIYRCQPRYCLLIRDRCTFACYDGNGCSTLMMKSLLHPLPLYQLLKLLR